MVVRKEINQMGLDPDYFVVLGRAIMKEGLKERISLDYMREKANEILSLVSLIEKGGER